MSSRGHISSLGAPVYVVGKSTISFRIIPQIIFNLKSKGSQKGILPFSVAQPRDTGEGKNGNKSHVILGKIDSKGYNAQIIRIPIHYIAGHKHG